MHADLPVNQELLVKDVFGLLEAGDFVLTNGDGNCSSPEFFVGTVYRIAESEIHIVRADGEHGGGANGAWLLQNGKSNDAVIVVLYTEKAILKHFNEIKFGDLVVTQNPDNTIQFSLVLQNLKKQRKLFVKSLTSTWSGFLDFENQDEVRLVCSLTYYRCSYVGCENKATTYVGNKFLCGLHLDAFGKIVTCHECGLLTLEANSKLYPVRGQRLRQRFCLPCYQIKEAEGRVIKEYNYKPKPRFITVGDPLDVSLSNRIFMGVENEVECPTHYPPTINDEEKGDSVVKTIGQLVVEKINGTEPWFYLKHDGSLDNGFELVTHPATLKGHYNLPWKELCELYSKYNVTSDSTRSCGLHIHANKRIMAEDHQMKLGYFIYKNQALIEKIARRENCSYANFSGRSALTCLEEMNRNTGAKYEALNWCPTETVEFRMFKGSIKYEIIIASIEFVHASIMFTSNLPVSVLTSRDKCRRAFLTEFVTQEAYPFLYTYLRERDI